MLVGSEAVMHVVLVLVNVVGIVIRRVMSLDLDACVCLMLPASYYCLVSVVVIIVSHAGGS